MVKQSIFILILFAASVVSACSQQPQDSCNKYSESVIGVSFCAPTKWTIIKDAGEPFQKVVGEEKQGLVPTISIAIDNYDGSLKEFATKSLDYLKKNSNELKQRGYSSVDVENQSEFAAKSTNGYRFAYNAQHKDGGVRLIQYVFAGKGITKIVVTAYWLPSDKDVLDKVFDDSMKTFEISL